MFMFTELILEILEGIVRVVGVIADRQGQAAPIVAAEEITPGHLPGHLPGKVISVRSQTKPGPKRKPEPVAVTGRGHRTRQCVKCGLTKGVTGFSDGSLECRTCERAKTEGGRG